VNHILCNRENAGMPNAWKGQERWIGVVASLLTAWVSVFHLYAAHVRPSIKDDESVKEYT
jgi:hypothetical protein